MKNLFFINLDDENDGALPELKALEIRTVSEDTANRQEKVVDDILDLHKKSSLPLVLSVIKYVFLVLGFCMTSVSISTCAEQGQGNSRIYAFLAVGIVLLIGFLILYVASVIKEKKVENSDEYKNTMAKSDSLDKSAMFELGIPDNAPEIDIFAQYYEIKNGKIKISPLGSDYDNSEMYVFEEKGILCLANLGSVYGIAPVNAFKKIEYIPEKCSFSYWSKEEEYNEGRYKEYKISTDKYETEYYIKNLCSLQFELNGEEFEIIIPPYDIHIIEQLTGLKAEAPTEE